MNSMVIIFRKNINYLSYGFIFAASFLLLVNALPFVRIEDSAGLLFSFLAPFFLVYFETKNARKGIAAAFAVLCGDFVFFSVSSQHFSLLFSVIASAAALALFRRINIFYAFYSLLLLSVVFGLGAGMLSDYLYELLKPFAKFLSNKPALFGTVNHFYETGISNSLADMFYRKEYAGSIVTEGRIISGAKSIFEYDNHNGVSARFLTGKYFVNIFLTLGVFASLLPKLKEERRGAFCLVCALAVIFGDVRLFSLFLLLYNPLLYLAYLFGVFISYFIASLLDIRIGFLQNGSIFELIKYGNKWGYFIVTGIVLCILMYFLAQLMLSKFNISEGRYYPKEVRALMNALGGERNIEAFGEKTLTVKNPNLINILALDCDIHSNVVSLYKDDLELLKEYLYEPS